MVDGAESRPALMDTLSEIDGAHTESVNSVTLAGNYIEVWPNDDGDDGTVEDGDECLLYPWSVESSPTEAVTEESQIELARSMRDHLIARGLQAVILASFEDHL